MNSSRWARIWHGATAVVGVFALVLQLILVILGVDVLVPEESPSLGTRLVRYISYFTIDSNILVLVTVLSLARNPVRDGRVWRTVRLSAVTGILVTGVVHWFFLRPLLDLTGWSYAVDKLLHVVIPLLAIAGWAVFGPRPRITWNVLWTSLIFPLVWVAYIMIAAQVTGWYPYPFLDVTKLGGGTVALVCLALTATILVVSMLLLLLDRRLRPAPAALAITAGR